MKKIIKKLIFMGILLSLFGGISLANEDSTRATGIDSFDVDYLPAGNKCGYSIGFVLGYHEGYLRKYVALVPVGVEVDSIINEVNLSTFGCSYDMWKDKLSSSTEICKDNYLKDPFIPTKSLGVYDSGLFLQLILSGENVSAISDGLKCEGRCEVVLSNITDIVSNKDDVSNRFPISVNSGELLMNVYNTGIVISYTGYNLLSGSGNQGGGSIPSSSGAVTSGENNEQQYEIYTGDIKLNWERVNIYPEYGAVEFETKEEVLGKKYVINYRYLNHKLGGNVTYDIRKLYNYDSFRDLWKGLYKVGGKLVIRPIDGINYTHFKSVDFSGSKVITTTDKGYWGEIHQTSEYSDNWCKDEYEAGNWWWVARNDKYGVTEYAKNLGMDPDGHERHVCASTWLIIKNPYFDGERTDTLDVDYINIGIDNNLGEIVRVENISKCDTEVLQWQRPKDADIDVSNMEIKIGGTSGLKAYKNGGEYTIYATDKTKICLDNIEIKSLPVDFVGEANNVQPVTKDLTAIQLVVRPYGSTNNIGESNKHTFSVPIDNAPTTLNGVCFDIDWALNSGKNAFTKAGQYWILLKFWADDEIRGNSPLITVNVIPNNSYRLEDFNTQYDGEFKADGRDKLKLFGKITDSFDNIVDVTNLISYNYISPNPIDINETTNNVESGLYLYNLDSQYKSDGTFSLSYVVYNKKVVNSNPRFYISVKKRNLDGSIQNNAVILTKSLSIKQPEGIFSVVLTGPQDIPFNADTRFILKLKNIGNSKVENLKIRFIPELGTDKIKFVPATGDVVLNKLLDGDFEVGSLNGGEEKNIIFTGRLELIDNNIVTPNVNIKGEVLVNFDLDGLVDSKEVTSYYDISSNLSVKYRGVYVEGLYSNAAKGLYELLRKADNYSSSQMSRSSASVDLKNKFIIRLLETLIR